MGKKSNLKKSSKLSTKKGLLYIEHTADPLFSSVSHPTEPIIVTGSATGRVQAYKYNTEELKEVREDFEGVPYIVSTLQQDDFLENTIDLMWSTKRHKGSCRGLCFDLNANGSKLYSIGSEGVIKLCDVATGKVVSKFNNGETKFTKCISPPGKPFLVVGDESGSVYCHDSRDKGLKHAYEPIRHLHNGEGINDIKYCWPKSEYKYITMGSTTVCEIDLRKPEGAVRESEDQEDEVLCGAFVDQERQNTMVCGMGEGIVTLWKPELNRWEDQISRVRVSKEESIDAVISSMDQQGRYVWAGSSDGSINKIDVVQGRCVEHIINSHPEKPGVIDEVTVLDLDYEYRLITGGMDGLMIWDAEASENAASEESDGSDSEGFDSSDDDDDDDAAAAAADSEDDKEERSDVASSHFDNTGDHEERSSDESATEEQAAVGADGEGPREAAPVTARRSLKRRFESLGRPHAKETHAPADNKLNEMHADANAAALAAARTECTAPAVDTNPPGASDDDSQLQDVSDSDDDNPSGLKTVPLAQVRDQILGEITEAYKTDDTPLKLSKKQRKKLKVYKGPGPEHGIHKFDDL